MKLVYCPFCEDLFRLFEEKELRLCRCGKSGGRYINNEEAVVLKDSISIGLGNGDLAFALGALYHYKDKHLDRREWIEKGRIKSVWVRPNSGPGNPHTKVIEKKQKKKKS